MIKKRYTDEFNFFRVVSCNYEVSPNTDRNVEDKNSFHFITLTVSDVKTSDADITFTAENILL